MCLQYFTTKSRGFTKILKVKICFFLNLYPFHAVKILDLSLEILLNPPKRGTEHLCSSKGFWV